VPTAFSVTDSIKLLATGTLTCKVGHASDCEGKKETKKQIHKKARQYKR
jgi:hypothetical protein